MGPRVLRIENDHPPALGRDADKIRVTYFEAPTVVRLDGKRLKRERLRKLLDGQSKHDDSETKLSE